MTSRRVVLMLMRWSAMAEAGRGHWISDGLANIQEPDKTMQNPTKSPPNLRLAGLYTLLCSVLCVEF